MSAETPDVTRNRAQLSGQIGELDALRYTPAGVPLLRFRVLHRSRQVEAKIEREVECEIEAVALGPLAQVLNETGMQTRLCFDGFLAAKRRGAKQLVLHVTEFAVEN